MGWLMGEDSIQALAGRVLREGGRIDILGNKAGVNRYLSSFIRFIGADYDRLGSWADFDLLFLARWGRQP
ncbi:MAG: SDR family oxidoreductase [Syntrophaceae bacterium]|nr:SDR family oxidoreductase [Syntrophaceae bacterium]